MSAAKPYRVLVTGWRDWPADKRIHVEAFIGYFTSAGSLAGRPLIIVHGKCPKGGVDLYAEQWAANEPRAIEEPHPADWEKYGRAAGPRRNAEMVALGADACLAFPGPRGVTGGHVRSGTWHCLTLAAEAGIPTFILPWTRIEAMS